MKEPFVVTLPSEGSGYRPIVKPPGAVSLRSGFVRLEPGGDVGRHSTGENEEMLVVLEGRGVLECEGCRQLEIAGGQIAYVPPRTRHNVINRGTAPLAYLYVLARAAED